MAFKNENPSKATLYRCYLLLRSTKPDGEEMEENVLVLVTKIQESRRITFIKRFSSYRRLDRKGFTKLNAKYFIYYGKNLGTYTIHAFILLFFFQKSLKEYR